MAKRVMTTEEKGLMAQNVHFKLEVKGAIIDKAQYWAILDGVNPAPPGGLERWRKSKHYGLNIVLTNTLAQGSDQDVSDFLVAAKTMAVVDDSVSASDIAAFTPEAQEAVIDYMLNDGAQPPVNRFDSLADAWMDKKIATWY